MKTCCLASLAVLALAFGIHAQSVQPPSVAPQSYPGTAIGASMHFDKRIDRTTQTMTLKFGPTDNPAFTVDYSFTFTGQTISQPLVVDEVITRYLPDEERPEFAFDLGAGWTPAHTRITSRSTMTRSMPVADFLHHVSASAVRERIFGSELVFSDLQLRMLRQQTVDRWTR